MPEDINAVAAELRKATEALESGQKNIGELTGKIKSMEAKLEANETENQKLMAKLGAEEKAKVALEDSLKNLEKQVNRLPNGGGEDTSSSKLAIKAFEKWIQNGAVDAGEYQYLKMSSPALSLILGNAMQKAEVKTGMQSNIDPAGGYLAPPEYVLEINKKITLISPIRQYAKVRSVSSPEARTFIRNTLVSSYWTGEAQNFTPSNSTYGRFNIPLHSVTAEVSISTFDLFGSAFNMETEINSDIVEEFARKESEAFVIGNGASKPNGIVSNTNVETVNSGVANDIAFDNFHTLYGKIKTGYKPVYGGNRATIARIRKMKDGVGQYLWQAGNVAAQIPNTINGEPYIEVPHMPDIGAGTTPVMYGDLARGYMIADGLALTIIRNPYRTSGFVIFTAERFVGGDVIMPEAIKLLKCSAA